MSVMSFKIHKGLVCTNCGKEFSLGETNFSEGLFDSLLEHNDNLLWICLFCKPKNLLSESIHKTITLSMKDDVNVKDDLYERMRKLENSMEALSKLLQKQGAVIDNLSEQVQKHENAIEAFKTQQGNISYLRNDNELNNESFLTNQVESDSRKILRVLQEIDHQSIKINDEERSRSYIIVDSFMKFLMSFLKTRTTPNNEQFSIIFEKYYCTGSFFAGLRITEASEFDYNIVLKIPKSIAVKLEFFPDTVAFGKIKWRKPPEKIVSKDTEIVLQFLTKQSESCSTDDLADPHFMQLCPEKILAWFQSLISKLPDNPNVEGVLGMTSRRSGPARTIILNTKDYDICVDLVPVFTFSYEENNHLEDFENVQKYPVLQKDRFWYLVPKMCKDQKRIFNYDNKYSFTVHFPEVEKAVMYDKKCAKGVIKFLKLLRDKMDWKDIASYHLKTVVMWLIDENPEKKHWDESLRYSRFIDSLKKLQKCLKERNLPYFMCKNHNLFHELKVLQCDNWSFCLEKIISKIERSPETQLYEILCPKQI